MTPKEAIEIVENEKPCCGEKLIFTEEERYEALNMAKEALEKQIPKKPLDKTKSMDDYGYCPNCRKIIDDYNDFNFCSTCGQAIDWSDEE